MGELRKIFGRSRLLTPIINNAEIKSAAIECSLIHKQYLGSAECEPDRYKGILSVCHVWVSSQVNTGGGFVNTIINAVIKSIYHLFLLFHINDQEGI